MISCPRCETQFEGRQCPECGAEVTRTTSGMLKTSAILISASGEESFYRSVQEVPEPLRRQLLKVTSGENAGTIVIADRAGREQLTQVISRRELSANAAPRRDADSSTPLSFHRCFLGFSWIVWAGAALLAASAATIFAVFTIYW